MNFIILLLVSLSLSSFASYEQAPYGFSYRDAQTIFVDFKEANYDITYDFEKKLVEVESKISFYSSGNGYPVFDLIPDPNEVLLNGDKTSTETVQDPDKQSTLRIIGTKIIRGHHQLIIKHSFATNVVFGEQGVASGFWLGDLTDRKYLEQYLPSNLEYDQHKMTIHLRVLHAEGLSHTLKANGKVSKITENEFEVVFPGWYTTSSMFFHLFPESIADQNVQYYYPSIDGRMLPVDIYTKYNVQEFVDATNKILAELENDYGPFPHDQLIIYGNYPSGGMEYAGATVTSMGALGHELFHSYHARALMPANGNAGWMDEAIARWRDNNYPFLQEINFTTSRLSGQSVWRRITDRMAYTEGSAFLSWIAFRMNERGLSFKTFLKNYFHKYKYTTVTTPLFQKELTAASGLELDKDFDQYINGKSSMKFSVPHYHGKDLYHPKLSEKELLELTWPVN